MQKFEYIISGSGFIALILALILKKNHKNFIIFEKLSKDRLLIDDQKSFALSKFTINLLTELNVWQEISEFASPIKNIYIYDDASKCARFERDFCIFENEEPMGFMIDSIILKKKLLEKIGSENVLWEHSYDAFHIDQNEENILYLKNLKNNEQKEICGKYFFVCEGRNSKIPEYLGIKTFEHDYCQTAFLFKIKHSLKHNYSALEKFFSDGMIATLPLKNQNESSIVWIIESSNVDFFNSFNKKQITKILEKKIEHCLGNIQIEENQKIAKYPLSLKFLSKTKHKKVFFIGDSAHAIHPVAGQGLNLSISDLMRVLNFLEIKVFDDFEKDENLNGEKINLIKKFSRNSFFNLHSMFFNLQMIGFTHSLNKIFLNDNLLIKFARNKITSCIMNSNFLNNFLKKNATGVKK